MRIFVLLSRFPYPLEKGDKLRAYNQIRYLSQHHEIHLAALNDTHLKNEFIEVLRPYCKSIHVLKLSKFTVAWNIILAYLAGKPFQVGYFYNLHTQKKIDRLITEITA